MTTRPAELDVTARYAALRQATLELLYLRNKARGEVMRLRAEMASARAELTLAVTRRDDAAALSRIGRLRSLEAALPCAEREHAERVTEAEAAKRSLETLRDDLDEASRTRCLERARAIRDRVDGC